MDQSFTSNPKLKTYSTLAAALLAGSHVADGAIVYKDINPDVTKSQTSVGSSSYDVDMDSDNTTDFTIDVTMYSGTYAGVKVTISPSLNNSIATKDAGNSYVVAMNLNDSIKTSLNWYGGSAALLAGKITSPSPSTTGDFANSKDKYVGVKFISGGKTYYGWIRLDVGNYNSFTIKDIAYQNTPNLGLMAGQTTVTVAGINNSYLNQITTITTDQHSIKAEFTTPINGSVTIINNVGAVVKALEIEGTTCSIAIEGMQGGLYHVYISSKEGILTKKIVLK
jgi:hypothetical protein